MKNLDEIKEQGLYHLFDEHGTNLEEFLEQCPSFNEEALNEMMGEINGNKYTSETNGINLFEQIMKLLKQVPLDEKSVLNDYSNKIIELHYQVYNDDSLSGKNKQEIADSLKEIGYKIPTMKAQQENTKTNKISFQEAFNDLFWLYKNLENTPSGLIWNDYCKKFANREFIQTAIEDCLDKIGDTLCDENGNTLKGRSVENFFIEHDPFTKSNFDYPQVESVVVRNIAYAMAGDLFDTPIQEFIDNNVLDEKELKKFINNNITKVRKQ